MSSMYDPGKMAIELMQAALPLLDKAGGETFREAACLLQHAIDIATDQPVPATIEEVDAALAAFDQAGSNRPANSLSR